MIADRALVGPVRVLVLHVCPSGAQRGRGALQLSAQVDGMVHGTEQPTFQNRSTDGARVATDDHRCTLVVIRVVLDYETGAHMVAEDHEVAGRVLPVARTRRSRLDVGDGNCVPKAPGSLSLI